MQTHYTGFMFNSRGPNELAVWHNSRWSWVLYFSRRLAFFPCVAALDQRWRHTIHLRATVGGGKLVKYHQISNISCEFGPLCTRPAPRLMIFSTACFILKHAPALEASKSRCACVCVLMYSIRRNGKVFFLLMGCCIKRNKVKFHLCHLSWSFPICRRRTTVMEILGEGLYLRCVIPRMVTRSLLRKWGCYF